MNDQLIKLYLNERVESLVHMISTGDGIEEVGENPDVKGKLIKFLGSEADLDPQNEVYKRFQDTIEFNGSRYVAELPLKKPDVFIPDNYNIAYKRLISLHFNTLKKSRTRNRLYDI